MDRDKLKTFWKVLRGRLLVSGLLIFACFILTRWVIPHFYQPLAALSLQSVHENQLIRIRKNLDSGAVSHLYVKTVGQLNGTAMLRVYRSDSPERIQTEKMIGPGKIDGLLLDHDWEADDCRMEYEPHSTTAGFLKIEYQFKTN